MERLSINYICYITLPTKMCLTPIDGVLEFGGKNKSLQKASDSIALRTGRHLKQVQESLNTVNFVI
jgi:hypothetical protein